MCICFMYEYASRLLYLVHLCSNELSNPVRRIPSIDLCNMLKKLNSRHSLSHTFETALLRGHTRLQVDSPGKRNHRGPTEHQVLPEKAKLDVKVAFLIPNQEVLAL